MYNLHNTCQECVHSFHFFHSSTAEKICRENCQVMTKREYLKGHSKERFKKQHTKHTQIIYDKRIPNKHCQCITLNLLFHFFFKFCFLYVRIASADLVLVSSLYILFSYLFPSWWETEFNLQYKFVGLFNYSL